jgi:hypothetical protein
MSAAVSLGKTLGLFVAVHAKCQRIGQFVGIGTATKGIEFLLFSNDSGFLIFIVK